MSKITKSAGVLSVPDHVLIPFIEGDGVGVEITPVCQAIVDGAVAKCYAGERKIEWKEVLAGQKAFDQTGSWLPEDTLNVFRECLVGIKGPLSTPVGGGIRSLNVALRQELDLYVCLRPVRYFQGIVSPVKEPQKVDMHIFRENTEDIYAGIEWKADSAEVKKVIDFLQKEMGVGKIRFPQTSAIGVKPVSQEGTKRLMRAALQYAIDHKLPSVTIVHKGNIMKFTEGGFRDWAYEVASQEFGQKTYSMLANWEEKEQKGEEAAAQSLERASREGRIIIQDVIADAFLQNTLLTPQNYSVIATLNLNGDYISDQLAAMVGGIGIAPGANINYSSGHAIFEATHGTAPRRAGQNRVNPSSLLLSSVMMLEYMGWKEAADCIVHALEKTLSAGEATIDLARFMPNGKTLSTTAFRDRILQNL